MAKQILVKVWSAAADSADEAVADAKKEDKRAIIYGASSLRELPHPAHLAEVENAFGSVGVSKPKAAAAAKDE